MIVIRKYRRFVQNDVCDQRNLERETVMRASLRGYNPERDFLKETYLAFEEPLNWGLERWNYARYFVAPMIGAYGKEDAQPVDSEKGIHFWEEHIGVWENEQEEIVGVVHPEHPEFGEAFLQRHPQYPYLLDKMLGFAEETLIDREKDTLRIHIHDYDETLQAVATQRGYRKNTVPAPLYVFVLVVRLARLK